VVDIKTVGDLNFTNYLNYSFTSYNNALLSSTDTTTAGTPLSGIPIQFTPSVQCGLGFSTGEDSNTIFKIRNFNINGVFTTQYQSGTYTYDVDITTLPASQNYTSPASPYFYTGDAMAIQNTVDGILNHTYTGSFSTTNPAITGNPLINIASGTAGPGAPYSQGDTFVKITPHA
jgi:hypothetical protein